MTYLARLTKLGLAKEGTQWTYTAPTVSVPFTTAKFTDNIAPLRDESIRANDSVLQGLNQGPWNTSWDITVNAYADLAGHFFRAIVGPDTVTAGVSTTLAANCLAGATTLSLTAAVSANSTIQISDATGANLEWVAVSTVSGSGPYTATVVTPSTGTKYAHTAAGGAVLSQSTHVFQQNRGFGTVWPTYSFTTDDGQDQLGWPGNVMSELAIKIDTKSFITLSPKFTGFPSAAQSTFAYAASSVQPMVGWTWTVANPGASTRGTTMDLTLKRSTEVIQASGGSQGPREVFAGALEVDGSYKAVYDSSNDMTLFKQYVQGVTTHKVAQPVTSGGQSLQITMSKGGATTGEVDNGSVYVSLSQSVSGIANTTDSGNCTVQLVNYVVSAY